MKLTHLHFCLLFIVHMACHAEDVNVPIDKSQSGNLYVNAVINSNVHSQFMVDTGAGMITLNRELFKQISRNGKVEKVGKIAARLANGKLETMSLYKVQSFSIGENCNLGEMEVAVMKHSGRNILGLSALIMVAPFSIHTSPMELILSGCPTNSNNQNIAANKKSESPIFDEHIGTQLSNIPLIDEAHNITSTTSPNFL